MKHFARKNRVNQAIVWLWALEAGSVWFGVFVSLWLQYYWGVPPCFLCLLDRLGWVIYGILTAMGWSYARQGASWQGESWIPTVRYALIALDFFHMWVMRWDVGFCISSELLALQGGIWSWVPVLDVRGCAQEPALWGLIKLPFVLLGVYMFWMLLGLIRRWLQRREQDEI